MVSNFLGIIHVIIIVKVLLLLANSQICVPTLVCAELALTLLRSIVQMRFSTARTGVQILLSMMLGYTMFHNKMLPLSWVFFIKTIEVHQTLKALRFSSFLFKNKVPFSYLAFLFDCVRFSLNQFMFVGIISLIYRFYCHSIHAPVPDQHIVIYQLIVTASTIGTLILILGFGDYNPKSQAQIIFFTLMIPFLCTSFVIHISSLVASYNSIFLAQDVKSEIQSKIKG